MLSMIPIGNAEMVRSPAKKPRGDLRPCHGASGRMTRKPRLTSLMLSSMRPNQWSKSTQTPCPKMMVGGFTVPFGSCTRAVTTSSTRSYGLRKRSHRRCRYRLRNDDLGHWCGRLGARHELAKGLGIGRVARMTGLGTGTVHKLKREMTARSRS
jgi:hypothetical protein